MQFDISLSCHMRLPISRHFLMTVGLSAHPTDRYGVDKVSSIRSGKKSCSMLNQGSLATHAVQSYTVSHESSYILRHFLMTVGLSAHSTDRYGVDKISISMEWTKILFYIKPWKPRYTCSLKLHCRVMWVFLYIKTLSDDCRFISSHYRQIRSGQSLIYTKWKKILFYVKPWKPRYTSSTKLHCHVTWVFLYQDTFWWL